MKPVAASLAAEVVLDHLGELPEVLLATLSSRVSVTYMRCLLLTQLVCRSLIVKGRLTLQELVQCTVRAYAAPQDRASLRATLRLPKTDRVCRASKSKRVPLALSQH